MLREKLVFSLRRRSCTALNSSTSFPSSAKPPSLKSRSCRSTIPCWAGLSFPKASSDSRKLLKAW